MESPQRRNCIHLTTDLAGFQTLLALPESTQTSVAGEDLGEQAILYVDTLAFDLLRLGYAVTIQPQQDEFAVTVEQLHAPLGDRKKDQPETTRPVTSTVRTLKKALNPHRWPAELVDALPPLTAKKKRFKPIVLLQQVKHHRQIDLPFDKASKETPTVDAQIARSTVSRPSDDRQTPFCPAESVIAHLYDVLIDESIAVTSVADNASAATTVAGNTGRAMQQLQRVATMSTVEESRLERALSAMGAHVPTAAADVPGILPTMSMAEACRALIYQQLVQMICQEAGVRYSDELEHVHQMRVTIRRLRATVKLFGQASQRKQLRPYLKQVRKTGQLLGAVRDLDVAIAKASKKRHSAASKQILAWQQARTVAHTDLVAWLDSADYQQFLADFYAECAPPPQLQTCDGAEQNAIDFTAMQPQQVRHVVPGLLIERFAAVRCYEIAFEQAEAIPYETLHALRIQGKYLRYSLEFTEHLLGAEINPLLTAVKSLQDVLGDLNDAVVAVQLLEADQRAKASKKELAYLQHQHAIIDKLRTEVPTALQAVIGLGARQSLGAAISNL